MDLRVDNGSAVDDGNGVQLNILLEQDVNHFSHVLLQGGFVGNNRFVDQTNGLVVMQEGLAAEAGTGDHVSSNLRVLAVAQAHGVIEDVVPLAQVVGVVGNFDLVQGNIDADLTKLSLDDLADALSKVADLEVDGQVETIGIAGIGQQGLCLFNIVAVALDVSVLAGGGNGPLGGRGAVLPVGQQSGVDGLGVDSQCDGLTDADIGQGAVSLAVEAEGVAAVRNAGVGDGVAAGLHGISGNSVAGQVHDVQIADFHSSLLGSGRSVDLEVDGIQVGLALPVISISLGVDAFAVDPLGDLERAGTNRSLIEAVGTKFFYSGGAADEAGAGQAIVKQGVPAAHVNDNGLFVNDFYVINVAEVRTGQNAVLFVVVQVPLHSVGIQRGAILEGDAVFHDHRVGQGLGVTLEGFQQIGLRGTGVTVGHQGLVNGGGNGHLVGVTDHPALQGGGVVGDGNVDLTAGDGVRTGSGGLGRGRGCAAVCGGCCRGGG